MGLGCSGEVSDVTYWDLAERPFACTPEATSKYSLHYYGRFKDDGIIILSCDRTLRLEFCRNLKLHSDFFKIKFESLSDSSAIFLDTEIYKVGTPEGQCRFENRIFVKATSLWQPLSCTSVHPSHIHRGWPQAQLTRFRRRAAKPMTRAMLRPIYRSEFSRGIRATHSSKPNFKAHP